MFLCFFRLTDIAPAKCQQTRYRSEFTAASRGFPATAWLSCYIYISIPRPGPTAAERLRFVRWINEWISCLD